MLQASLAWARLLLLLVATLPLFTKGAYCGLKNPSFEKAGNTATGAKKWINGTTEPTGGPGDLSFVQASRQAYADHPEVTSLPGINAVRRGNYFMGANFSGEQSAYTSIAQSFCVTPNLFYTFNYTLLLFNGMNVTFLINRQIFDSQSCHNATCNGKPIPGSFPVQTHDGALLLEVQGAYTAGKRPRPLVLDGFSINIEQN